MTLYFCAGANRVTLINLDAQRNASGNDRLLCLRQAGYCEEKERGRKKPEAHLPVGRSGWENVGHGIASIKLNLNESLAFALTVASCGGGAMSTSISGGSGSGGYGGDGNGGGGSTPFDRWRMDVDGQ